MRHAVVPAVYAILEKENKLLLMLRQNTGYRDGFYTLPSGHVEKNETPTQAVIRELEEEVGIKEDAKNFKYCFTLFRKSELDEERVDHFFVVTTEKEPTNMESDKCKEIIWAEKSSLPENFFDYIKYALDKMNKKEIYAEWGY